MIGEEDINWFFYVVDNLYNGLIFCVGLFSVGLYNNVFLLVCMFVYCIYFVYLCSINVFFNGNFIEVFYLGGCVYVIELICIFEKECLGVLMCVDYGCMMLDDVGKGYNLGYLFYGCMMVLV